MKKAAISQHAAHFSLRFSSARFSSAPCRLRRAVSTEVSTTFSPTYPRSTPASEITSDPWMTTPAFKTWSRISSRETSASPGSFRVTGSKSIGIGNKRIRRPGAIYFDAPHPVPPLYKLTQDLVPLFTAAPRHQESGLPQQTGLRSTHLSGGRCIGGNFLQRRCELAQFWVVTLRTLFDLRSFLLQVLLARPYSAPRRGLRRFFPKYFYAPLIGVGYAVKYFCQRTASSHHIFQ